MVAAYLRPCLASASRAQKSARQHARRRWCQASTAGRIRSAKRAPPHRRSTTAWPPSLGHTVHLCTRPLSPARSVLLEAAAAHLQCSDRAAGSELTLRSHPDHRAPSRRLRKRCVRSCTGAELRHSGDVPHRGACRGRRRPSAATQSAALTAGAAGPRPGVCTPNPPAPALAVGRPAGGAGASGTSSV